MGDRGINSNDTGGISNYDVLVEPPIPGMSTTFNLAKPQDHVGNNRLQVFLDLNRPAYVDAKQRSDLQECNKIVDAIVDTVCNKCVPRGRFLVCRTAAVSNGVPVIQWHQIDESTVKELLHNVLNPPASPEKSLSSSFTKSDDKPDITPSTATQSLPEPAGVVSSEEILSSQLPPISEGTAVDDDDGQKRRRRSSLLRRSVSESHVGLVSDNKKKLNRSGNDPSLFGSQEEPASWKSSQSADKGTTSLNRMDVILTPARNALDPNSQSVGNNRLHILVAMSSGKYEQGSIEEREEVLDEVIRTVNTFWMGRFMVEGPEGYQELNKDESRNAMRTIFDLRANKTTPNPLARFKRHSAPLPHTSNLGILGGNSSDERAQSRASTNTIPLRFFNKDMPSSTPLSNSILPTSDLPNVDQLRSMAVKSLQQQKARQKKASKLQQQMGAGSNALPAFPLGGMIRPSSMGRKSTGSSSTPVTQNPFPQRRRESGALYALDPSIMDQLVAEFGDADCNDNAMEPVPIRDDSNAGINQTGTSGQPNPYRDNERRS